MKTYFEPKINGVDELFSNLVTEGSRTITAVKSPTTTIVTESSPTVSTYVRPKMNISSIPISPVSTTPTSSATSTPTRGVTTVPKTDTPTAFSMPPSGGSFGGGASIGDDTATTGEVDSTKKVGDVKGDLIFGFKRNHVYGVGLLAVAAFVYIKYIKK